MSLSEASSYKKNRKMGNIIYDELTSDYFTSFIGWSRFISCFLCFYFLNWKLKFLYIIYVYGLYSTGCYFSLAKPSSPTQLRVISYTWGSIELEWKEGYDGGCPQSFLIETQQTAPVSAGNVTRYNLTGMSLSGLNSCCLLLTTVILNCHCQFKVNFFVECDFSSVFHCEDL